jgi:hypothetical protein
MSKVVSAYGISATIPVGWEALLFRHKEGEPTLHVATFRLPPTDGEFGSRATAAMPPEALFFSLTEYRVGDALSLERGLFAEPRPKSLRDGELHARSLLRGRPGQRGLQRFFSTSGRAFCLYVVVSGGDTHGHLMRRLNDVLQTLHIDQRANR